MFLPNDLARTHALSPTSGCVRGSIGRGNTWSGSDMGHPVIAVGRAASVLVGVLVALRSILEASQDLLQKASASSAGVSKERPPASAVQQRSAKERRSAQMDTAQGWAADAGHAEVNASVRHDLRCKQEPDCLAAGADPLFVPRGPRGVDDAGRHRLS